YYVPATGLAEENGLIGLANIILMGKMLALTNFCSMETMKKTFEKIVPPRKQHLIEKNLKAIEIGMNS
ncbi:MAG: 2-oxoacid:ferredoxin oxidoreductase subunit gamma, partial [Clostridiales bacterium]|nr:2-oxoacid:ferredoxin oxidoreductase subunit gamma [Clostridiales bacterium]